MNGYIDLHFKLINDEFFLNIYKINYLLIAEEELINLENKNFNFIKKFKTSKHNLYLYKRNVKNYSLNKENLTILIKNLKNCKVRTLISDTWVNEDFKLDCLLRNRTLFDISDHKLLRLSNGNFSIKNTTTNQYPVLPFDYDANWKSNNDIINGDNFLMLIKVDNELNKQVIIKYKDNIRYFLKILSMISFLLLIFIIFFYKIFTRKNSSYKY